MRILHLMLSCFYIDGWSYQENELPRQNKRDGHEVKIIASTESFVNSEVLGYVDPRQYINEDGIMVERVPYSWFFPHFLAKKVRKHQGIYYKIQKFSPDIILFHGAAGFELLTVSLYKKNNPSVKLYVDSHEDFHNSARNWISREFLHKRFYAHILNHALPYIDIILCISLETMDFLKEFYRVPKRKMEFYPLGGKIINREEREKRSAKTRKRLGFNDSSIIFSHSGKFNLKKRTLELMEAFSKVCNPDFKLVLAGSFLEEIKNSAEKIIANDARIRFLGWQEAEELRDLLCASDMYLQPGSQSATMQNALCCGCPVMLYPHKSHEPFLAGNGFFIETKDDMINTFQKISDNPKQLGTMSKLSYQIASKLLDYKILAARLYQ